MLDRPPGHAPVVTLMAGRRWPGDAPGVERHGAALSRSHGFVSGAAWRQAGWRATGVL